MRTAYWPLDGALANKGWDPRRWWQAYGNIRHLPIDRDGSELFERAEQYRIIQRGMKQRLEFRAYQHEKAATIRRGL